jgi:hypothetical protein
MKFRLPELVIGCLLTVAIFSVGSALSGSRTTDSKATADHEEKADDKVARYTLYLAVLTGGLVVVSAWQGIFLLRADRTARMSAEAAQAQAINFTKLERPYIYIFDAKGLLLDDEREDPYHYLTYTVANYGKTPATIDGVFVGISVGSLPGELHQRFGWHELLVSPILTSDQKREKLMAIIPELIPIGEYADEDVAPTPIPELPDGEEFFFQVLIKYHGPFSSRHETSVCWRWDMRSLRPVYFDNDAFNYTR